MKGTLYSLVKRLLLLFFQMFPIKENRILCNNFYGKGFSENPKYIVEELLKNNNYEIIWVVSKKTDNIPPEVIQINKNSIKYIYYIATSKIWISNVRLPRFYKKRKNQFYIQTWHGGIPLKKVEFDVKDKLSKSYIKSMINDNKMIDIMISGSSFTSRLYKESFHYIGKILEVGQPKCDFYFKNTEMIKDEIIKKYDIGKKRIILYAPTFRNNYDNNPYDIDLELFKKTYEKKTNEQCCVIVKMHPNVPDTNKTINCKKYISLDDEDMEKLIIACDVLITDYSSIMFESILLNKEIYLYVKDIKDYEQERGFYFSLNELPFPIIKENSNIEEQIFKNKNYLNKYNEFKNKIGLYDNGNASTEVVKIIKKQMEKNYEKK